MGFISDDEPAQKPKKEPKTKKPKTQKLESGQIKAQNKLFGAIEDDGLYNEGEDGSPRIIDD